MSSAQTRARRLCFRPWRSNDKQHSLHNSAVPEPRVAAELAGNSLGLAVEQRSCHTPSVVQLSVVSTDRPVAMLRATRHWLGRRAACSLGRGVARHGYRLVNSLNRSHPEWQQHAPEASLCASRLAWAGKVQDATEAGSAAALSASSLAMAAILLTLPLDASAAAADGSVLLEVNIWQLLLKNPVLAAILASGALIVIPRLVQVLGARVGLKTLQPDFCK